jgi:hypothetical protein
VQAPLGFFVDGDQTSGAGEIKRPLLTDVQIQKEFDSVDVILTTRYAPCILCGEAIAKVTGLATS